MSEEKIFKSEVIKASRELTAKEKIQLKDTSTCIKLDEVTDPDKPFIISCPKDYVLLHVHNDFADDNKDYNIIVIYDENGEKYSTGSARFINDFIDYFTDLTADYEEFSVEVRKMPSKNYKNKFFLKPVII